MIRGQPQPPGSIVGLRRSSSYDILIDMDRIIVRDSPGYMQIFIHPDLVEGGT